LALLLIQSLHGRKSSITSSFYFFVFFSKAAASLHGLVFYLPLYQVSGEVSQLGKVRGEWREEDTWQPVATLGNEAVIACFRPVTDPPQLGSWLGFLQLLLPQTSWCTSGEFEDLSNLSSCFGLFVFY